MDTVVLKSGPHRVLKGSPWIYRTELEPTSAQPGSVVQVKTREGKVLGQGFFNPRSMIAVRVVAWGAQTTVTDDLFRQRVRDAADLRQVVAGGRDAFRVIHSEAHGIPGLIVDKYGPMLVAQVTSLGLLPFLATIWQALTDVYKPVGIYEHGDLSVRDREGLPRENRLVWGELTSPVEIHEHGVRLEVDLLGGQKTGHFLDQYENRGKVAALAGGRRVFDAFSHTGAFGLAAALHGAESVVGIDIDPEAVDRANSNAAINGVEQRTRFVAENAFDWLRRESDLGPQYDLGILDPPAFTKSKQSVPQAIKGYKEINLRGIKLIRPGGFLITSSCSYHLSEPDFIQVIQAAAHDAHRAVRIVEIRGQGPDHPILPALPESRYLKCLILGVGK
ncbi:class I SAM-dependent rRNA methyltransferase [Sulfobacillus harzensis]|uniref:class I SAM-dependent rRNA methyltransferase n=1 Tax=Sulfobacillus harzensis TaxID=2729629 RepID=UPI00308464D3